jgi:hypothetical protein
MLTNSKRSVYLFCIHLSGIVLEVTFSKAIGALGSHRKDGVPHGFFSCPRDDPESVGALGRGAAIRRSRHSLIGRFQNRGSSRSFAADAVIARSGLVCRIVAEQRRDLVVAAWSA